MVRNKPSDKVVACPVTFCPITPAEFTHVTVKLYCISGLNSVTVSKESAVPVSAVNSFPPANLYLTLYLTVPLPVHPLNANTTDREVIVLP